MVHPTEVLKVERDRKWQLRLLPRHKEL